MKALVVDDEPIARRRLARLLRELDVEVAGEADSGERARELMACLRPDVVFLDIRMPGLDGLTLALEDRAVMPPVVFVTAHDEHAVAAFEAEAVDYLLKPVERERLRRAVERVQSRTAAGVEPVLAAVLERLGHSAPVPRISARLGTTTRIFDPRRIARFHAHRKYVAFTHQGVEYLTDESLDSLERRLAPLGFARVHRAELVNLERVTALHLEGSTAALELATGERVPVSRRRLPALRRALGL